MALKKTWTILNTVFQFFFKLKITNHISSIETERWRNVDRMKGDNTKGDNTTHSRQ